MTQKEYDSMKYAELSRRGGELALRYQAAVREKLPAKDIRELADELIKPATTLALRILTRSVRGSRKTATGVPGSKDERDLLQETLLVVMRKLEEPDGYKDEGHFAAWVGSIATSLFLKSLNVVREKPADGRKGEDRRQPGEDKPTYRAREESLDARTRRDDGDSDKSRAAEPPRTGADGRPVQGDDPEANMIIRDLLNLVLAGLQGLPGGRGVEVWTARVFLGMGEAELREIYGLGPDTVTSHFRRASIDILEHVRSHPEYRELSLKGLRHLVLAERMLEERDLSLLNDELHRKILALAVMPETTLEQIGEELGLSVETARKTLRAAIVALSRARVRRAEAALVFADDAALSRWLWEEMERFLDSYPAFDAVRAEPNMGDGELAALCQLAAALYHARRSMPRAASFGELVGVRVRGDGLEATARALGLDGTRLMGLLSGAVRPEGVDPALLARLAEHFRLEPRQVAASLRAGAEARMEGRTRSLTPDEAALYLEGVRRQVLDRIGRP